MSKILLEIPPQGFELIRDRVGEILADEIAAQFVIHGDPERNAKVFVERITPIDKTELPLINVLYSRSGYDNNSAINSDGKNTYNIDVYTSAKTKIAKKGGAESMTRLGRILGIIRAILESPFYLTLGFATPFIMRTEVTGIEIQDPRDNQDAANIVMGRLIFVVDASEDVEQIQPVTAEGYDTQVKLHETEKGFVYVTDN